MLDLSPESVEWLTYATNVTRNGNYDEQRRGRTGYSLEANGTLVTAGVYSEGGHTRIVIDSAKERHKVTILGYLSVFNGTRGLNTEVMFLEDGRAFQFEYPSGGESIRNFIAVDRADEILQEAVRS